MAIEDGLAVCGSSGKRIAERMDGLRQKEAEFSVELAELKKGTFRIARDHAAVRFGRAKKEKTRNG